MFPSVFPSRSGRGTGAGLVRSQQVGICHHWEFGVVDEVFTRYFRPHTVPTVYESALTLVHDTLHFAPTLQQQHATLATSGDCLDMPLDYGSYQVDLNQVEKAFIALERGRALLWSEMRRLPHFS